MKIGKIDVSQLQSFLRAEDWNNAHSLLDYAQSQAVTPDDISNEKYWRVTVLIHEERYEDAINFLKTNAASCNSQCLVQQELANLLIRLRRDREALFELSQAPFEDEMEDFYGLAIDAKFLYFYLLAKSGDRSIKDRLSEIPDDYRHITMDGKFLTKSDLAALIVR